MSVADLVLMQRALALARPQAGRTGENPAVGCVIVKDGAVIGEGATADSGRPHAEEQALAQAGGAARGATAYVTLEPCAQRTGGGKACSQLLIEAGVARVVYAVAGPRPSDEGQRLLQAAGIAFEQGLCEAEARAINADYFERWEKP